MKNYCEFTQRFITFVINKKYNLTESYGNSGENFLSNISKSLNECKIFEISNNVKQMLLMTEPPLKNDHIHLPFEFMFIDIDFTREELEHVGYPTKYERIIGIVVSQGNLYSKEYDISVGTALRITICSEQPDGQVWFDTFNKDINLDEDYKTFKFEVQEIGSTDVNAKEVIHKFVLNFINFLNNPEIEVKTVEHSKEQNQKRIKRNKYPIPIRKIITVTGKLKKYITELENGGHFKYSHRFWVRGHYRTLRNESRYKNKTGKRIWIYPFIKGDGLLVDKQYNLK